MIESTGRGSVEDVEEEREEEGEGEEEDGERSRESDDLLRERTARLPNDDFDCDILVRRERERESVRQR
jgi:hypothetical protein